MDSLRLGAPGRRRALRWAARDRGYLFNIAFLRRAFQPSFELHGIWRSGPLELTTRWTMAMSLTVVPPILRGLWSPSLLFTGVSLMSLNPASRKISRHVDRWDSVRNNDYLSTEAVADMFRQARSHTPQPHFKGTVCMPFVIGQRSGAS